jgi:hypothetical protein
MVVSINQPGSDLCLGMNTRDFDYGVGDDIDNAVQRTRAEIAARIRQAASSDVDAPSYARRIYDLAIRIAESTV